MSRKDNKVSNICSR